MDNTVGQRVNTYALDYEQLNQRSHQPIERESE